MSSVITMPEEQYWGALERVLDSLSADVWSTLQTLEAERELLVRVDEVLAIEGKPSFQAEPVEAGAVPRSIWLKYRS